MRISTTHRGATGEASKEEYIQLALNISDDLSLSNFEGILLCGSAAKNDLICGWSDLDIVVVCSAPIVRREDLDHVRNALDKYSKRSNIGVGLDICGMSVLQKQGRIGGRPLAMTYEVAEYAKVLWGRNCLLDAPELQQLLAAVLRDAQLLSAAELHNWHRQYLEGSLTGQLGLASSIKTALKLLKHSVEPFTKWPFTHSSYLEVFSDRYGERFEMCSTLFEKAIRMRIEFPETIVSKAATEAMGVTILEILSDSKLILELESHHDERTENLPYIRSRQGSGKRSEKHMQRL